MMDLPCTSNTNLSVLKRSIFVIVAVAAFSDIALSQNCDVILANRSADFKIVGPTIGCSPTKFSFQYDQVSGTRYTWKWYDGTPDSSYKAGVTVGSKVIKHKFYNLNPSSAVDFNVTLTITYSVCSKSTSQTVSLYAAIVPIVFPDKSKICSGETVQLSNQSVGTTSQLWFYRIVGNPTELEKMETTTVAYTFNNSTTQNPAIFEVIYRGMSNNCTAPDFVSPVKVYRGVVAGFDEGTVPYYIGGKSTVIFTNTSNPVDANSFRYNWNFGSDSSPPSAIGAGPLAVDYSKPGQHNVTIDATNTAAETDGLNCFSEFRKTISVPLLTLVAGFEFSPRAACFPSLV